METYNDFAVFITSNGTPKTAPSADAATRIARQDKDSKSHVLRAWTGQDDGMATFVCDFEL